MFKIIRVFLTKLKKRLSYNVCYNEMEHKGVAVFGMCSGVSGSKDYIEIGCIGCPYLCATEKEGAE